MIEESASQATRRQFESEAGVKDTHLNNEGDLELRNTVSNWDELAGTPDETVLVDLTETCLQSLHVSLVIPWLDVEGDDGLGGGSWTLGCLLLLVLCDSLSLNSGGLGVLLLVVRAEEVDVVVVSSSVVVDGDGLGGGRLDASVGSGREESGGACRVTVEVRVLLLEGCNVGEPSGNVGVLVGVRCRASLEDGNVGTGDSVATRGWASKNVGTVVSP